MKRTILSLLTAALLAASALSACSGESDPPLREALAEILDENAPVVRGATMPADIPEPATYEITFDRYAPPDLEKPEHLTQVVRRPFSETVGASTRTLGFQADSADADSRVVLLRPAPGDPRPRVYGAAQMTNRVRRVLGRLLCREYRVGPSVYCVGAHGLVLASNDGTRVDIATKAQFTDEPIAPSDVTATLAKGFIDPNRGSVRPIDPSSTPPATIDWSLPTAPDGFTHVGRYTVIPLSAAVLARTRKIAAGIVDVYLRGIDTVIVDRGGRLDSSIVTDEDLGPLTNPRKVDLGRLGASHVGVGGDGPFGYREVRALSTEGRYVVVAGTLPADELVSLARSLQPGAGTGLKYLDVD